MHSRLSTSLIMALKGAPFLETSKHILFRPWPDETALLFAAAEQLGTEPLSLKKQAGLAKSAFFGGPWWSSVCYVRRRCVAPDLLYLSLVKGTLWGAEAASLQARGWQGDAAGRCESRELVVSDVNQERSSPQGSWNLNRNYIVITIFIDPPLTEALVILVHQGQSIRSGSRAWQTLRRESIEFLTLQRGMQESSHSVSWCAGRIGQNCWQQLSSCTQRYSVRSQVVAASIARVSLTWQHGLSCLRCLHVHAHTEVAKVQVGCIWSCTHGVLSHNFTKTMVHTEFTLSSSEVLETLAPWVRPTKAEKRLGDSFEWIDAGGWLVAKLRSQISSHIHSRMNLQRQGICIIWEGLEGFLGIYECMKACFFLRVPWVYFERMSCNFSSGTWLSSDVPSHERKPSASWDLLRLSDPLLMQEKHTSLAHCWAEIVPKHAESYYFNQKSVPVSETWHASSGCKWWTETLDSFYGHPVWRLVLCFLEGFTSNSFYVITRANLGQDNMTDDEHHSTADTEDHPALDADAEVR